MTFLVCTIAKMADPVILGMMSFLIIFYVFSVADPYTDLMNKKSNSVWVKMKTSEEICLRRAL